MIISLKKVKILYDKIKYEIFEILDLLEIFHQLPKNEYTLFERVYLILALDGRLSPIVDKDN